MLNRHGAFDWNEQVIARLRLLWNEGHLSTAEIAGQIGVSKNAVIGKAHRLGLAGRTSPIKRGGAPRATSPKRLVPPKLADLLPLTNGPPASVPSPSASRPTVPPGEVSCEPDKPLEPPSLTIQMPTGARCCWPIGDPGKPGFRFCDAPLFSRVPYCPEHTSRAYAPRRTGPHAPGFGLSTVRASNEHVRSRNRTNLCRRHRDDTLP